MHNPLKNLLQLCKELDSKSDKELQTMLEHMAFYHPENLIHPVRLLLQNSTYIESRIKNFSNPCTTISQPSTTHTLSLREQQVLNLLAQGYTFPRIGEHLFISPATVSNHCARIREKLGLRGRNSLIAFALSKTAI